MVLEYLLKEEVVEKRPLFALFVGFVFTFIGAGTAFIFFGKALSIAMLFLATLLIVPNLIKLFDVEEKRERREGLKHFFHNHGDVFEVCLFLFIGVFFGYLVMGGLVSVYTGVSVSDFGSIFDYQVGFLESQQGLSKEMISGSLDAGFSPSLDKFVAVTTRNIFTALVFFVLSLFYGAGAIFLIVLNASIFSTFIIYIIDNFVIGFSKIFSLLGIFLLYSIPEISGFLLAAIAGAVVSKAIMQEKVGSKYFRNVFKDATVLLLIAFLLIIIAGVLEIYVGAPLFYSSL